MEKIELRKVRDFGALFNGSIAFLRLNFKSYFGIIILLAGPFVLLTGLLMGYLQFIAEKLTSSSITSGMFKTSANMFVGNSVSTLLLFGLIFLLTTLVTNASIALYFKLYDKATPEELPIQRSNISPLLTAACWRLFYNLMLFSLIACVVLLAVVGVFALLFLIPYMGILVGIVAFFAYIILIPALAYIVTVANFIVIRDEILITAAIGKAWRYMRGSFWWTWLLVFCTVLSLGMIYMLFNMPYTILIVFKSFTRHAVNMSQSGANESLMYVLFSALSMFGSMVIISPIFTSVCIFNFYNHEERHEGTSLMSRIDTFDKN